MSDVILNYYDESRKGEEVFFNDAPKKRNLHDKRRFYKVIDEPDKLIKYSVTGLNVDKTIEMLHKFRIVKGNVTKTDLPDTLYLENGVVSGTVNQFYENAPSLYMLGETHDLSLLSDYYSHDDNAIHNYFLLMSDILDIIEELKDNSIRYTDCNPGNLVLQNNQVHLIDFDPNDVHFDFDKKNIRKLLESYDDLFFVLSKRFKLIDMTAFYPKDFKSMRKRLTKVENKIMKNMR